MGRPSTSTTRGATRTSTRSGRSSARATTCCCRSPSPIDEADTRLAPTLDRDLFERLAAAIPDLWLPDDPTAGDAESQRAAYVRYLDRRLAGRRPFVEEAERARRAA